MSRRQRYGTKGYAAVGLRRLMREWAARRRKVEGDTYRDDKHEFGVVLGARTALCSVGALDTSSEQYRRLDQRIEKIIHAEIKRRPFVDLRRAA